jgi:hypothetical protein
MITLWCNRGGAGEGNGAPASPRPAATPVIPGGPDRAIGVALEVDAIGVTIGELRCELDQIEQNFAEIEASLLDRRLVVLGNAAARLQALAGHMLKTIERGQKRPKKSAA